MVDFDASGSTDDNGISSYSWNFGDGSPVVTGIAPSRTYGAAGNYTAILTVTDAQGLTDTASIEITVSQSTTDNLAPIAMASATPLNGEAPLLVDFDASGSSDDNGISSYSWNFGDGSPVVTDISPSRTYGAAGNYTAVLTVTDAQGLTDAATLQITVSPSTTSNLAPIAIARATPLNGDAPLLVNFDASESTDDNAIITYSWNFGDGSPITTGINPAHTYTTEGIFQATLIVTDAQGLSDIDTLDIQVTQETINNTPPIAIATASIVTGETPLIVNFDASDSTDDNIIATYSWDFGDGTDGSGINPTHTYNTVGVYEITLLVIDEEGLIDTTTLTITVTPDKTTLAVVKLKDIEIYPNPVGNENLNINLSDFMNESIALGLYDIYGKLVFQNIIQEDHPQEIAIDVSFLSNGIYLLEITRVENNEYTYKKIIKVN